MLGSAEFGMVFEANPSGFSNYSNSFSIRSRDFLICWFDLDRLLGRLLSRVCDGNLKIWRFGGFVTSKYLYRENFILEVLMFLFFFFISNYR